MPFSYFPTKRSACGTMRLIARVQRTANELHEQHQKMTVHVAVLTKTKHLSPHALCATAARGTQIHARCVGTVSALQYSYIFPPAPPLARHQVLNTSSVFAGLILWVPCVKVVRLVVARYPTNPLHTPPMTAEKSLPLKVPGRLKKKAAPAPAPAAKPAPSGQDAAAMLLQMKKQEIAAGGPMRASGGTSTKVGTRPSAVVTGTATIVLDDSQLKSAPTYDKENYSMGDRPKGYQTTTITSP
eukprot:Tamp_21772.p1 GENE.Tamp_21772~~Tamp_21772.p1  ORF type:complete len:242 (+),score=36.09 Tamp_21772:279-1004(+)